VVVEPDHLGCGRLGCRRTALRDFTVDGPGVGAPAIAAAPAVERRAFDVAQQAVGARRAVTTLAAVSAAADGRRFVVARRLTVLGAPAVEERLNHLAGLAPVFDVLDRQKAGHQERMDVLVANVDGEQVPDGMAARFDHRRPSRRRFVGRSGQSAALRLCGFFHPQCLFDPLGRSAQALQPLAGGGANALDLMQGVVQPPQLAAHQLELAAQPRDYLGPELLFVDLRRPFRPVRLVRGRSARSLVRRHRRSPRFLSSHARAPRRASSMVAHGRSSAHSGSRCSMNGRVAFAFATIGRMDFRRPVAQ
jgi:hypothetical protein